MDRHPLVPSPAEAAADNATWCAAVWTSLGISSRYEDGYLVADARTPAGFPELVTLSPGLDPRRIAHALTALDPARPGLSVKDSFADLALDGVGFLLLLDGAWIVRAADPVAGVDAAGWEIVSDADGMARWVEGRDTAPAFGPSLLHQDVVRLVRHRHHPGTGFALTVGPHLVGVSNVRAGDLELNEVWTGVLTGCARWAPGRGIVGWEVVGWEVVDDLAAPLRAGFVVAGPLRVWTR